MCACVGIYLFIHTHLTWSHTAICSLSEGASSCLEFFMALLAGHVDINVFLTRTFLSESVMLGKIKMLL